MMDVKKQFEDIMNGEHSIEEKKRLIIDNVNEVMKEDDNVNGEVLEMIKDTWNQLVEQDTSGGGSLQLENEYRQAIRNFNKQKDRVDNQKEGIKQKEELLKKAEELTNSEDFKNVGFQLKDLKNDWEDAAYAGKDHDPALNMKFREAYDKVLSSKDDYFDGLQANRQNAKEIKEALIKKAQEASTSNRWKETSQVMRNLMDEWKQAGHAGREDNDALWEPFNEARQNFFARQDEHFVNMRVKQAESLEVKKTLIEEAQSICQSEDFKETAEKMQELMRRWKQAGSAGREHEDSLWEEFSNVRQIFYTRQNEFYEQKKGKFVDNLYDGIKRRNKQLADLEAVVKDLEERSQEIRNLDPVLGNQEDRWEITNERNQELAKYQDYLKENYQKIEVLKEQLSDLNDKYERLTNEN